MVMRMQALDMRVAQSRRWADGAVTGTTGSWDSSKSGVGIFVNSHFDSGNIEVELCMSTEH